MLDLNVTNQKIFDLVNEAIEIEETDYTSDFNTRDKKICANIKVNDWLDIDDVLTIINEQNLMMFEDEILDEFDEQRLSNIWNHTCEDVVIGLKEQYESNCDLTNFRKLFNVWHRIAKPSENPDWYEKNYLIQASKFKTKDSWIKHIVSKHKEEYERYSMRDKISKIECSQYGRSGGWLSVCDQDEVDFSSGSFSYGDIMYDLDGFNGDDKAFNQILADLDYFSKDKQQIIKTFKEEIQGIKDKLNAVKTIVEEIEETKKGFKGSLIEKLSFEIEQFLGSLNSENKDQSNVSISIEGDLIKTSLGISVNKEDFIEGLNMLNELGIDQMEVNQTVPIKTKVGNYFVQRAKKTADDIIIKAGCHRFSLNNINAVLIK